MLPFFFSSKLNKSGWENDIEKYLEANLWNIVKFKAEKCRACRNYKSIRFMTEYEKNAFWDNGLWIYNFIFNSMQQTLDQSNE